MRTCGYVHVLATAIVARHILRLTGLLARGGEEGIEWFHSMFVANSCILEDDASFARERKS